MTHAASLGTVLAQCCQAPEMDRERVAAYKQRPLQEALVDAAAGFLAASAPPDEEAAMDAELAASAADAGAHGAAAGAGDTPGVDGPLGPPPGAECALTALQRDSAAGRAAAAADRPAAAVEPARGQPQASGEPAELRRQLARVGLRARFYFTKARQLEAALARQAAAGARLRRANEALSARLAAALAAAAAAPEGGPSAAPELTAAMGPGAEASRVSAVVVIPAMQAGARPRAASAPSATGRVVVVRPPEPASTAAGEPEVDGAEAAGPEPMPGPDEGLADMMQGPGHAATRGPRLSLDAATLTLNPGEDPLASQTSLEWVEGLMRAPSQGSQPELHLAALGAAAGAAAAGRPPGAPGPRTGRPGPAAGGLAVRVARLRRGARAGCAAGRRVCAGRCARGADRRGHGGFGGRAVGPGQRNAGSGLAGGRTRDCRRPWQQRRRRPSGRSLCPGPRRRRVRAGPAGGLGGRRARRAPRQRLAAPAARVQARRPARSPAHQAPCTPMARARPLVVVTLLAPSFRVQGISCTLLGKRARGGPRAADRPPAARTSERPWRSARQSMPPATAAPFGQAAPRRRAGRRGGPR